MLRILRNPLIDGGLLLFECGAAFGPAGQIQPAGQVAVGACRGLRGQAGYQCPDVFVVVGRDLAAQQWGDEYALACGGEGLTIGFQGTGTHQLGANLLLDRQFTQTLEAGVLQGFQGALGLLAGHCQLGLQGAGEDLLGGLQAGNVDLLENAGGAGHIVLLIALVGSGQAQQGGLFRFALGSLLEHLFDAGLWRAWQLAQVVGGRAGAGSEQAGQKQSGKRAQASDHRVILILEQNERRLYPRGDIRAMPPGRNRLE